MIPSEDMRPGVWYKDANIMFYPYEEREGTKYTYSFTHYGKIFSILTYQVVRHMGTPFCEIEDSDEWMARDDKFTDYTRSYIYWDERQWTIEGPDIKIATSEDIQQLIKDIFEVQIT